MTATYDDVDVLESRRAGASRHDAVKTEYTPSSVKQETSRSSIGSAASRGGAEHRPVEISPVGVRHPRRDAARGAAAFRPPRSARRSRQVRAAVALSQPPATVTTRRHRSRAGDVDRPRRVASIGRPTRVAQDLVGSSRRPSLNCWPAGPRIPAVEVQAPFESDPTYGGSTVVVVFAVHSPVSRRSAASTALFIAAECRVTRRDVEDCNY
jgi:hypothetical protein